MTKLEMILEYLKANEELFNDCMDSLFPAAGYENYNDSDIYYLADNFGEEFYSDVESIVIGIANGHDEETGGPFDIKRMYYRRDEDGNYISSSKRNYKKFLNKETIKQMNEHYHELTAVLDDKKLLNLFESDNDVQPDTETSKIKPGYWKIEITQENNKFLAFLNCERYAEYKQCILCWNTDNCNLSKFANHVFNDSFINDAKKDYIESLKSDIANFGEASAI